MSAVAAAAGRGEPALTKLSLMRRAMARQMVQGAAVPCFYLRASADVTALLELRRSLRASAAAAAGVELPTPVVPSVNDFVIRAVALELRARPEVNSALIDDQLAVYPRVNVGVAIAVPGGLVVPAVYDADKLDVSEISAAVRELADLAARRKLGREVLSDATFSISNLGMYGIEDFDPIINVPQAAILSLGAARAVDDGRSRVRMTLGCDHRVLTGAEGAPFLTGVRDRLEQPDALLRFGDHEEE